MSKHTFTTPVSMKVTEKQYNDDLKGPLLELGYKIDITLEGHSFVLVTNRRGEPKLATDYNLLCANARIGNNRHFIDHYNPKLFLALAAKTSGEDWIIGEYLLANSVELTSCYGDRPYKVRFLTGGNLSAGYADNYYKDNYRKATKQELINHFTKSNNNTNMANNKKIFPLQLSPQNAQRIIDIACTTWTSKLAKSWGADIVQNKTIDIHKDDYEIMRAACDTDQNILFDEIFGSDKPISKNAITTNIADQIKDRGSLVTICKIACNTIDRADLQNKSLWVRDGVEIIIHEDRLTGGKILEFKIED